MFKTNADIVNDMYGIQEYNAKQKKNIFKPLGKAALLQSSHNDWPLSG